MQSYLRTIQDAWIAMPSGVCFNPFNPIPETIELRDVAVNLGGMCRYSGSTRHHYSVAEHAVLVSRVIEALGYAPVVQACGLHHDDAEAYGLPDVAGPVKLGLHGYDEVERGVLCAAATRFGLPWPFPAEVEWVDGWIRQFERQALPTPMLLALPPADVPGELAAAFATLTIEFWPRERAAMEFIHRHVVIQEAREKAKGAPMDMVVRDGEDVAL